MKKIILVVSLLFVCLTSFAYTYTAVSKWRWRNNDGSETSATWSQAQSTPVTYTYATGMLRLRIELTNMSNRPNGIPESPPLYTPITPVDTLQYSTSPGVAASWINIDDNPAKAFVLAGALPAVAQGTATTPQLNPNSYRFSAGLMMTSSSVFSGITLQPQGHTEVEWAIKATPNLLTNTTYYFRQYGSTTNYYNSYPALTTASLAPLPVKLTRFSVGKEGGRVRIEWTTATEEASDRFEVWRSTDGRNWQTLTQVQSVGNATTAATYSAYDDRPLSGLNQYRLKQVDKDGKSAFSDVKSVRLFTDAAVLVWPNPASAYLNFSLQQAEAQVMVTLQDATGRTVQQETFNNLQAGAVSKWALPQKMPAGIYILKLEADGFSEARKVIIQ